MSIKKVTNKAATTTATETKATKAPELKTENLLEIQQSIIDNGFQFDKESFAKSKVVSLENQRKIYLSNSAPIKTLADYKAMTVRPQTFALKRIHFNDDYTWLTTVLNFCSNGFELVQRNHDLGINYGVSISGKTPLTAVVNLQTSTEQSTGDELKALAAEAAQEAEVKARTEFFTVDNISQLANKQLEANKQFNLQLQQKAAQEVLQAQTDALRLKIEGAK